MREIKFRAWDEKIKYMHATDSVSLCIDGEICYLDTDGEWVADMANRITLMQYTGLKDCNGVEIYEDDIIVVDNGIGYKARVYFGGGAFKRVPIGSGEASADLIFSGWYGPEDYKVIGNIYENPELLK